MGATQRKIPKVSQSKYLIDFVSVLGLVMPIIGKLLPNLPIFMLNFGDVIEGISSNEANSILTDIYNFINNSTTERDSKYRFSSILQANITTLSSKYYLLK